MKEQLLKLAKNPVSASAFVGSITFAAGAGVGYILGRRKRYEILEPPQRVGLVLDADALAELEDNQHNVDYIENEDDFQPVFEDDDSESDDEEDEDEDDSESEDEEDEDDDDSENHISAREFIKEKLNERLPGLIYEEGQDEEVDEPIPSNIFAASTNEWDYETELAKRTPDAPYVIHEDEFHNDEAGFHQISLIWYAGDQILADQENQPVYNYSDVIGEFLFGHGSSDPNVFFVRNHETRSEFEITYDPGRFSIIAFGTEIEDEADAKDVKHSNSPKRFQME